MVMCFDVCVCVAATGHLFGFLLRGMFPDKFVQQQDEQNSSEKKADRCENGRVIERFCMHGGASMITVV